MHPDLMGTARFQPKPDKGIFLSFLFHPVMGYRPLAVRPDFPFDPFSHLSDRQSDHAFFFFRDSVPATPRAQSQEAKAMNISSRRYLGSPQA